MNAESYLVLFFMGFLGFFNSASLEARQVVDSNAELLFQNGMIVSTTIMVVTIAGSIGETVAFARHRKTYKGGYLPPMRKMQFAGKKEEEE